MANPFSDPTYMLSPIIAIFVCAILIFVVIYWGQRSSGRWVFTGILTSILIWSVLIFGMRASPDTEHAIIWAKLSSIPATATFVLYYHFTVVYTRLKKQRAFVISAYLVLIGISILAPTGAIIEGVKIANYGYAPIHGDQSVIVSIISFPLLAGGMYNLVKAYRASRSYEERNRLVYLLIAIMFPVVGSLLDALTNLPPMLVWTQSIFVLICSISIVKFHLLDIRIFFRRSLAYLLISMMVAFPYITILVMLNILVDLSFDTWWHHTIAILALAMILQPLQGRAQRFVDRLFYRDRYDHLLALERLNRDTQSILDVNELCATLIQSLLGALRISKGCVFIRSTDNNSFVMNSCSGATVNATDIKFKKDSTFINWLSSHDHIIAPQDFTIITQLQSLTPDEKRNIEKLDVRLFIPVRLQGNELSGFLALGEKSSGGGFTIEDRQLISTISSQIAISLENARLYNSEKTMRETLEKMDIQKTEFLHSVAHELKTPLTALLSSSEILNETTLEDESVRQRLYGNISRSAQTMNRRVSELLDLASAQIGDLKLNLEHIDIGNLLLESASQITVLFDNRSQHLKFDIADNLPTTSIDKDKIQQVIFNLLSNANKYSPDNGEVILKARHDNDEIFIQVIDHAEEISEENQERVFTPYFRTEDTIHSQDSTGLGLGLAISKRIVDIHGGRIWVEKSPAGGNIFQFTIPVNDLV